MIIRLVAAALVLLGGLGLGLEYVRHQMQKADINLWHIVFGIVGILLGILLFLAADSLAEQLTDDVD